MNFVKLPDSLPHPQKYLRAGLPRPTQAVGSIRSGYAQNTLCGDGEVTYARRHSRPCQTPMPRSTQHDGSSAATTEHRYLLKDRG
jgi:hypothetical protein